jgi:hypothetical protein
MIHLYYKKVVSKAYIKGLCYKATTGYRSQRETEPDFWSNLGIGIFHRRICHLEFLNHERILPASTEADGGHGLDFLDTSSFRSLLSFIILDFQINWRGKRFLIAVLQRDVQHICARNKTGKECLKPIHSDRLYNRNPHVTSVNRCSWTLEILTIVPSTGPTVQLRHCQSG